MTYCQKKKLEKLLGLIELRRLYLIELSIESLQKYGLDYITHRDLIINSLYVKCENIIKNIK